MKKKKKFIKLNLPSLKLSSTEKRFYEILFKDLK